ncbi:MAG: hypothetical protein EAZ95_12720, partial [Bacteroidetes bacterium]
GNLGLTGHEPELEQLKEFVWVEEFNFLFFWQDKKQRDIIYSQNKGAENKLAYLPSCLPPNLQALHLPGQKIHDISFLSGLTSLAYLKLSYNQIHDISFLAGLTGLTSLDLQNNQIHDISFLAGLTGLTSLELRNNQIHDISFLADLTGLTSLDLNNNQIQDISSLLGLTGLTSLYLSNNQIHDISFLAGLTSLNALELSSNQIHDISFAFLSNFPQLKTLSLWGNPIQNIPPEIFNKWNCLESVRRYFEDLEAGKVRVYQSKVVVVGNGRVGKTCLLKRWLDNTHNPDEPSTHAITMRAHFLPELAGKMGLDHVQLNVWDFGGQDIYHSTHRLFMQTKAVFLVVWDWETEQTDTQTEVLPTGEEVAYQNLSLLDWLDYVQTLGKGSPAIVVQTKTALHKKRLPPSQNTIEAKGYPVAQYVSVDSALDAEPQNGFKNLRFQIECVLEEQIQGACVDLPASWWRVQVAIQALQSKGEKMLSLPAFADLCQTAGLPTESIGTVQSYLHDTGAFFYRQGLFHDQIILDQQWAISAVYTLFDRQGLFQRLQRYGFFKGQDLIDVWQASYKAEEQELFVSFMVSCRICMEISEKWEERGERRERVPLAQREYIAPQLLPDTDVPNVGKLYRQGEGYWVALSHPFLHESVMQEFILRTADYALRDNLRKHQILVEAQGDEAWVQALPKENKLLIRIKEEKDKPILDKIRNTLADISKDITGIAESVSLNGVDFVPIEELKNRVDSDKYAIFIPQSKEVFGGKDDIQTLINKGNYFEVFKLLKGCKDQFIYNQLKQEFMQDKTDFRFVQRLQMLAEEGL